MIAIPIPITRKGCKNVGWVWDETKTEKLVVPLHIGEPVRFESKIIDFTKFKPGSRLTLTEDYSKMLPIKIKPIKWYQFWRRG